MLVKATCEPSAAAAAVEEVVFDAGRECFIQVGVGGGGWGVKGGR